MRIKSGIEGFDALVQGGFPQGRQYLLSGTPGSGKTTFGVQFLAAGALEGEIGAYIALSEIIGTVVDDMSSYNLQIEDLIKKKKLFFIDLGPSINYGEYDEMANLITPDYNQQSGDNTCEPSTHSIFCV